MTLIRQEGNKAAQRRQLPASRNRPYIVKPFNKNDLYTSIEICLSSFATQNSTTQLRASQPEDKEALIKDPVFIRQGQNFQKIKVNDIIPLENDKIYINVHTVSNKFLVAAPYRTTWICCVRHTFCRFTKAML